MDRRRCGGIRRRMAATGCWVGRVAAASVRLLLTEVEGGFEERHRFGVTSPCCRLYGGANSGRCAFQSGNELVGPGIVEALAHDVRPDEVRVFRSPHVSHPPRILLEAPSVGTQGLAYRFPHLTPPFKRDLLDLPQVGAGVGLPQSNTAPSSTIDTPPPLCLHLSTRPC